MGQIKLLHKTLTLERQSHESMINVCVCIIVKRFLLKKKSFPFKNLKKKKRLKDYIV